MPSLTCYLLALFGLVSGAWVFIYTVLGVIAFIQEGARDFGAWFGVIFMSSAILFCLGMVVHRLAVDICGVL